MSGLPASPLLPLWVVLPMAAAVLIALASYATALQSAPMDPKRRRIRTANTVLMMFATPLIAYAFGIATPASPHTFMLVWLAITGMLAIIVLLAAIDAIHSARLHREHLKSLRRDFRESLAARGRRAGGAAPELRLHRDDDATDQHRE